MKKIKKAEIDFPKKHYPRRKELEALSDKQCEMVRVINWLVEAQAGTGTKEIEEDLKDIEIAKLRGKQEELRQIVHSYDLQATEIERVLRGAGIPKIVSSGDLCDCERNDCRTLTLIERIKLLITETGVEDLSGFEKPRRKLIDTISPDSATFYFSEFNLAMLESGRYHVEKHRAVMERIKVGSALADEFYGFIRSLLKIRYDYVVSNDGTDWKIFGAEVEFANDDVYYMKPYEILFLSDYDRFYARAIKK